MITWDHTLIGAGSSDPAGGALIYTWVQTNVPPDTAVTWLTATTIANPRFRVTENVGTKLQFQVTVSDGLLTDVATVTVTVGESSRGAMGEEIAVGAAGAIARGLA